MNMRYEHWIGYGPDGTLHDRLILATEITQPIDAYFPPGTADMHQAGEYDIEHVTGAGALPSVLKA
jgi:hypothetical protein